jgi:hypothetical protein
MTSRTATAFLSTPREEVFAFLSEIENLPRWATEFARELRNDGQQVTVINGLGEFVVAIEAEPDTGVIDIYAGPDPDHMALFPTRVIPLPNGGSAYSFTMFQDATVPDDLFESQYQSLLRELDNLRRAFG